MNIRFISPLNPLFPKESGPSLNIISSVSFKFCSRVVVKACLYFEGNKFTLFLVKIISLEKQHIVESQISNTGRTLEIVYSTSLIQSRKQKCRGRRNVPNISERLRRIGTENKRQNSQFHLKMIRCCTSLPMQLNLLFFLYSSVVIRNNQLDHLSQSSGWYI